MRFHFLPSLLLSGLCVLSCGRKDHNPQEDDENNSVGTNTGENMPGKSLDQGHDSTPPIRVTTSGPNPNTHSKSGESPSVGTPAPLVTASGGTSSTCSADLNSKTLVEVQNQGSDQSLCGQSTINEGQVCRILYGKLPAFCEIRPTATVTFSGKESLVLEPFFSCTVLNGKVICMTESTHILKEGGIVSIPVGVFSQDPSVMIDAHIDFAG